MPAQEPAIGGLEARHAGAFVDRGRAPERHGGRAQRLRQLGGADPASFLQHRGDEAGGEPRGVRRGHAGAALDLVPGVPARHGRERHSGRHEVGLGELPAARAPPAEHVEGGRRPRLGRAGEGTGKDRTDRECQVGGTREPDGRQARPVVAGADREHDGRVRHEKGIHDGVDHGLPLELVSDPKAQVQHQRQVALLGVAGGVLHGALHRAVHGNAAPRAVGDLETQELGPRRHAVESRHVEQIVAGRDARDVGAVPTVVEHDIELGDAGGLVEVRGQGDRLRAERNRLTPLAIVVQRHFVFERAVQIRVEERHPAVGRLHDNHGKDVGVGAVAVQIGRRRLAQGQLGELSGVPGRGAGESPDTPRPGQLPPAHRYGAVPRRRDRRQRHPAFVRKVPQLDDLRRAGAGGDEPVHARIDTRVQDPDQHPPPVVRRMLRAELIDPRTLERHQSGHERHRRWQGRLRALGACVGGRSPDDRRSRRRRGRRDGVGRATGARGSERGEDERTQAYDHVSLGKTKGPRCGPVNSVATSSRNATVSRVSSGSTSASTKPRAPANLASS